MLAMIAGGGTGGHIFPALALGEALTDKGIEVVFVGTKMGLESGLVPKKGWKIEYLSTPRWKGEGNFGRLLAVLRLPFAIIKGWKLISKYKPEIVIGVGGYVSVPVVVASFLRRVPNLIMEQNSIPGLANRILGRFVDRICITFPASEGYFSRKKVLLTGNPVRSEIMSIGNNLPMFQDKFIVICFGGSQGAKSINKAMFASLKFLRPRRQSIKIIHQIGSSQDIEIARDIYEKEGFDAEVHRFIDDMAECYSRSHLAVCRAGATSITELTVVAKPALLVPYPYAANNHQEENAKYVAEGGGAIMILDKDLTGEKIAELITKLMSQPDQLSKMNEAMKSLSRPDAADVIADECLKLASTRPLTS